MKNVETDIIIIGAGLTGLTLAYYLKQHSIDVILIEARERLGGRIYTKRSPNNPPIELGATWVSTQHTLLLDLINELELQTFEQELGESAIYEAISTSPFQLVSLPGADSPSYRIKNGTDQVIEQLASKIDDQKIYTNQTIKSIHKREGSVIAKSNTHTFNGTIVVSTLPPLLFANSIVVNPPLPSALLEKASKTHTRMGDSIKIALTYKEKFWNEKHLSGTIFSNVGPIPEMYDHSNFEVSQFALKGFFNGAYFGIQRDERLKLALSQLEKYYGKQVTNFIGYEEIVWKNERYTSAASNEYILPHQNNGDLLYQQGYLNNSLFLAGTETSPVSSGYMEGAISSAKFMYSKIQSADITIKKQ
jgi:monoamine oxidase